MRPYFEKMTEFGKPLSDNLKKRMEPSIEKLRSAEKEIEEKKEQARNAGLPTEKLNQRGEWTVYQRLEYLIDPGTWCPLHTLFDPMDEESGTTAVVDGIGRIAGKWAVVIGFDNKVMAGAWVAGQAENILRVTDLSKRLHIPLVWLVNCSGVKLAEQEKVYANRRGNGTTFYRHAELEKLGIPVLAAIWGTNPAGGGYQSISPTYLLAHKNCNMAVGGAGIVSGMSPKGTFDLEGAEDIIKATQGFKEVPPGRVEVHYNSTGFFKEVYETEESLLDGVKDLMKGMPAYDPKFFRVAEPAAPRFEATDIEYLIPFEQKQGYNFDEVLARLTDNSEHMEFRPDYGFEVYTGLAKIDGFLVGIIGNRQGLMPKGYPEYASYPGIGGKLYRQGLIKMNEFVSLCGRDRLPIIWLQDTTGIDVGDIAEKAELLGLGQALIYSIEQTELPMMKVLLRKGTAAAHYLMGGPQGNDTNAFAIGTPTSEVYVMHGETAAVAAYARRLVKEKEAGRPLQPIIDKMNQLAQDYQDKSRPAYCAKMGMLDEIVNYGNIRNYMVAFANSVYQNPRSICPQHHLITPRIIKG
jgi:glutaconyl-CoA decarboxylase